MSVLTCYYKVVVGLGSQFCTQLEVWVLGVSIIGSQTSLYSEDRGLQVPMSLEHDKIGGFSFVTNCIVDPNRVDKIHCPGLLSVSS
jgi:hypothetical protein